jgi:hypothetical protein
MNNTIGNFIDFIRVKWELGEIIANPKEAKALAKLLKSAGEQWEAQREKLSEFTGHTKDFDEALGEMLAIREALAETFDENQKLERVQAQSAKALVQAQEIINAYRKQGPMFAPEGVDGKREDFIKTLFTVSKLSAEVATPSFSQEVIEALKPLLTGNKTYGNADIERARKVYFALTNNNREQTRQ